MTSRGSFTGMYSERHLSLFLLVVSSSLMKDYFFKPPINQFSLNFLDQELERSYRSSYQEEVCSPCHLTAEALVSWDTVPS